MPCPIRPRPMMPTLSNWRVGVDEIWRPSVTEDGWITLWMERESDDIMMNRGEIGLESILGSVICDL